MSLETHQYHYQKVLSDIAGQDIENHNDDPETLVKKVRNWFSCMDFAKLYPETEQIWKAYNKFIQRLASKLSGDINELPVADFIKLAKIWTRQFK